MLYYVLWFFLLLGVATFLRMITRLLRKIRRLVRLRMKMRFLI